MTTKTEIQKMVTIIVNGVIDRLESREPGENTKSTQEWSDGVLSAGAAMLQEIATKAVFMEDIFAILESNTNIQINSEVSLTRRKKLFLINELVDHIN